MRLSYSKIKMWRLCAQQYFLCYIAGVGKKESAAACQGTALHETARHWEESGRTIPLAETFRAEYARAISETEQKQPRQEWRVWGKKTIQEDIADRMTRGVEQAERIPNAFRHTPPIALDDGRLALETLFEMRLDSDVTIVGGIDRIDRTPKGLRVVDLKTGARENSPLQLGVYRLAAQECLGITPSVYGAYWYAKDGKMEDHNLARFTKEYVTEQASHVKAGIESGRYPPMPGGHCFNCPVKQWCPELGHKKAG